MKTREKTMSKFDDDIRRIAVLVNDFGDGRDGDAWDRLHVVLEAAGKVDKETVSVVLGDVRTLLAREGRTAFIWAIKDALALLSALPDKGPKP